MDQSLDLYPSFLINVNYITSAVDCEPFLDADDSALVMSSKCVINLQVSKPSEWQVETRPVTFCATNIKLAPKFPYVSTAILIHINTEYSKCFQYKFFTASILQYWLQFFALHSNRKLRHASLISTFYPHSPIVN